MIRTANWIMCGFMGCGKSTVGRQLARLLRWEFVDLDQSIEDAAGMKIPELFAARGEAGFRALESDILWQVCTGEGQVISTGGGALLRPENGSIARENGIVVFLNCPFAVCYERIRHSDRPLVRQNTLEELERLHRTRLPLYRAVCHIETAAVTSSIEIAEEIRSAETLLPHE